MVLGGWAVRDKCLVAEDLNNMVSTGAAVMEGDGHLVLELRSHDRVRARLELLTSFFQSLLSLAERARRCCLRRCVIPGIVWRWQGVRCQ